MKKLILLLMTVLAISAATTLTHSDKFTITGTVSDNSGEPLIGATIIIKNTTEGVITDFDGNFSIVAADSCVTLVISYTGYSTLEFESCAGRENKIVLEEGAVLDEVVVTSRSLGFASKAKGKKAERKSRKSMKADAKPADQANGSTSATCRKNSNRR
jgi:hypothetical protein